MRVICERLPSLVFVAVVCFPYNHVSLSIAHALPLLLDAVYKHTLLNALTSSVIFPSPASKRACLCVCVCVCVCVCLCVCARARARAQCVCASL